MPATTKVAAPAQKAKPTLVIDNTAEAHPSLIVGLKDGLSYDCPKSIKQKGGVKAHPYYRIWQGMLARCYNENHKDYASYNARGIVVCEEWQSDLDAFAAYVDECLGSRPSPRHSIDRIDNNRGYEPGNVRWANDEVQANNRRSNRRFTFNGVTQTMAQWARQYGINPGTLAARLKSGLPLTQALRTPVSSGPLPAAACQARQESVRRARLRAELERKWRLEMLDFPDGSPRTVWRDVFERSWHLDGDAALEWFYKAAAAVQVELYLTRGETALQLPMPDIMLKRLSDGCGGLHPQFAAVFDDQSLWHELYGGPVLAEVRRKFTFVVKITHRNKSV